MAYPIGVKAFKAPADQGELDEPWSEVVQQEKSIVIKIACGTTRREAMKQLHHTCAKWLKHIDCEALKEHVASAESKAKNASL